MIRQGCGGTPQGGCCRIVIRLHHLECAHLPRQSLAGIAQKVQRRWKSIQGHQALEYMATQLKEKTDGRITMEIFPGSQLGSEREQVESIQLGNLDMTFV